MARAQWHVRPVTDPPAAIDAAAALVEANPVAYSVFSTVAASLVSEPTRFTDPHWWVVEDAAEQPVLVAMQTPPHPLHLPQHVPGAAAALADHLLAGRTRVTGVSGPKDAVDEFVDHYLPGSGVEVRGREGIGVYDLPVRAHLPWPVEGELRIAGSTDVALVASWVSAFMLETGDQLNDPEATARRQIGIGKVSLWVVEDRPVAMCWASDAFGGVVRVSGVYTPRAERGHGYASAVVAAASRREQDAGHLCMLYTQLANPTSNKIYRALGYRYLGDDLRLTFVTR
ncbi:GNAT family N-acetyltransferase [Flexivirga oryzae]|uniref:Putative GNAT family acetyltransferase n=1 Tax=Flexivirga oryzae TaxID=1794944 RepID=A0A839NCA7_9MICO|nr:GNAT family N-acetyltransferase [Flexivirga oryzae]MBB2893913.1 putative GNAT family acetyltransferase [Flexivirga oryzae]